MSHRLGYVLTGARGGPVRTRILAVLDAGPRSANQLAAELDLEYDTVCHHLDVLDENDLVEEDGDERVYLLTDEANELLNGLGQTPLAVE